MTSEAVQHEPDAQANKPGKQSLAGVLLKIVLLLVVLVIGAVGVLYAMGGNEIQFVVQQEIEGKRADIYKLITDDDAVKEWVEGIKSIEPVGDIKEYKVGAKGKIIVEMEGTELEINREVTMARRNQETEMKMTSGMFDEVHHFKLDFKNDAGLASDIIVVTQHCKIQFKGFSRIMAPFCKQAIEDQVKKNLVSLKELVKKEPADEKSDAKKSDAKKSAKKKSAKKKSAKKKSAAKTGGKK